VKFALYNDHYQNWKSYQIQKAQLVIADIPYNIGKNAYGSNPSWYIDGDNANGESDKAGKEFFDTDKDFRITEFLHFCSTLMIKEPKETGKAPCMIVFCEFEQQFELIEKAKRYGLNKYINLVFRKNFSAQVLKANMRIVGNCEYGLLLYRDKLPKFNNDGKMVFNCIDWERDTDTPKIHPCLPAGEQVYFNGEWKNIECVEIGDANRYGTVIHTSQHIAKKLVEIECGGYKTVSTWNHPFLVKRENKIYWINAEQIKENDLVLSMVFGYNTQKPYLVQERKTLCDKESTKKRKKVISGLQRMLMASLEWNIVSSGKNITAKFRQVCRYITKILTKQTTIFPICNLSLPLNTSGITLVADLSTENGKSLAKVVENTKRVMRKIGIFQEDGSMGSFAKNVSFKSHLKQERFLLQKVGSVKVLHEKTIVYNLTIDGIPAFDTAIGLSHNTQKPVKLLERLIRIFTDEGDVVIDPVAGSGSTLLAAMNCGRRSYGFEIKKDFYREAMKLLEARKVEIEETEKYGFSPTAMSIEHPVLFGGLI